MASDPAKPARQRKTKPEEAPKRRARGFLRAAELTTAALRQAGGKRGFAELRLLTEWTEIAGAATARICRPVKVSYAGGGPGLGATLVLAADGARGPEIEAQRAQIIERVNAYYGYRAVSRISIDQRYAPVQPGFAEPAAAFGGPPPRAAAPVEGVDDQRLALALGRLQANIKRKSAAKAASRKGARP